MTEPFSYEDTQFVADTIGRETVEQAHAILTGLVERGWTPPAATEPETVHPIADMLSFNDLQHVYARTLGRRDIDQRLPVPFEGPGEYLAESNLPPGLAGVIDTANYLARLRARGWTPPRSELEQAIHDALGPGAGARAIDEWWASRPTYDGPRGVAAAVDAFTEPEPWTDAQPKITGIGTEDTTP